MSDRLTILPQPIQPARPAQPAKNRPASGQVGTFDQFLQQAQKNGGVKFSAHAQSRMAARGINFDATQLQRLEQAVARVDAKGGRDSLVMLDDTALVVSVKNETVVTVVDRDQMKNNVFTQIDSAVIA
jgi:flagellar operon protein